MDGDVALLDFIHHSSSRVLGDCLVWYSIKEVVRLFTMLESQFCSLIVFDSILIPKQLENIRAIFYPRRVERERASSNFFPPPPHTT